jgi:hypothetical protein
VAFLLFSRVRLPQTRVFIVVAVFASAFFFYAELRPPTTPVPAPPSPSKSS